jgi:hypothetical protein
MNKLMQTRRLARTSTLAYIKPRDHLRELQMIRNQV